MGGTYRLYIEIRKMLEIDIGKLGKFKFSEGNYIYTGSAMKNLLPRIERHLRKVKTRHWHIDFLLSNKEVRITKIELFPSEFRMECIKNREILNLPGAWIPVKGFGSSDCSECPSHLAGID